MPHEDKIYPAILNLKGLEINILSGAPKDKKKVLVSEGYEKLRYIDTVTTVNNPLPHVFTASFLD